MPTIAANGTTLYYEQRGEGPPLLFISGGPGDAGFWTEIGELLAAEYTVVSYDRRGNSRSPRPENGTAAPVEEQADDAAALLEALDLAPAVVHGHSAGGIILTSLALRRPDVLRGAIFHEPAYVVTPGGQETFAGLQQRLGEAMAEGGPAHGMEVFLRWADGDEAFESLDTAFRDRMLGDAEILGLEMGPLLSYMPTPEQLAAIEVPCVVVAGADNRDPGATHHWAHEASQWMAESLGAPLVETPGAHGSMITHAQAFVSTLRPLLVRLSASSRVEA